MTRKADPILNEYGQPTVREYNSDIILGEKYRDRQSGLEGVATAIYFFQHACERVTLEYFNHTKGELQDGTFDAPRLTHVETQKQATTTRTGGPARERNVRPGPC